MKVLEKYKNFMGVDNLSYLYTDEDALLVINTYKIGTRFVGVWQDKFLAPTEFQLSYKDKKYITFDSNNSEIIKKIGNKEKIKKDILVIYRNPLQKTITGLVEDFIEACLKLQNEDVYFKVLDVMDNTVYKKIIEKIRKNYLFTTQNPNTDAYKEFSHFFTENEYVYDTNITTASVWKEFFFSYVLYRMRIFSVSDKHSAFWCFPCYLLTKEFLEGKQNFYLFDLDDKKLNLAKFLVRYKDFKNPHYINSEYNFKYSNNDLKKWAFEILEEKELIEDIISRLETELITYKLLKGLPQNLTPEMV